MKYCKRRSVWTDGFIDARGEVYEMMDLQTCASTQIDTILLQYTGEKEPSLYSRCTLTPFPNDYNYPKTIGLGNTTANDLFEHNAFLSLYTQWA